MTTKKKLLKKFLERPESLKFRQIEGLLMWLGFERVQAKGSHVKYRHVASKRDLIVPAHDRECLFVTKRKLQDLLKIKFYERKNEALC